MTIGMAGGGKKRIWCMRRSVNSELFQAPTPQTSTYLNVESYDACAFSISNSVITSFPLRSNFVRYYDNEYDHVERKFAKARSCQLCHTDSGSQALIQTHRRVVGCRVAHVAHRGMRLHPTVCARSGGIEVDKLVVRA